jgi:hypothetical protein
VGHPSRSQPRHGSARRSGHARYIIRDRDGKYPKLFDSILVDTEIKVVLTGVQMPRMNAVMERWIQSC